MKKARLVLVALVLLALVFPASLVLARSTDKGVTVSSNANENVILRVPACVKCDSGFMRSYRGPWGAWHGTTTSRTHLGVFEVQLERSRDWGEKCDVCGYTVKQGIEFDHKWDCKH